jgi:O-antigen ligase
MTHQDSMPPRTVLEQCTLLHVLVLLLSASWLFGGNIWWMRTALSIWASCSVLITLAAFLQPGDRGREARRRSWWLLPWLLFIIMILASALNPSFTPMTAEGSIVLVNTGARWPNLPSCIEPAKTLHELWFYAGVYLSGFNLLLVLRRRRLLQMVLLVGMVNCLLLAVYGTMQKLLGAGYYFGAAVSPNPRFFGTFIYNNHWGTFMILWLGVGAGLLFYHATRHSGRDLWHSPVGALLVALLLMATTAPLSASRAATAMALATMALVMVRAMLRIRDSRRGESKSSWPPVAAMLLIAALACGAIGWLAQRSINERYVETRAVITGEKSLFEGRMMLYRDTWNLAMRQPWFGWGLESYASTYHLIRPRPLQANRQYETSYAEAHSDWLQSVAETGLVGTTLAVLMGLIPLAGSLRRVPGSPITRYAWFGCSLVLLYAWIEFPFANGAVVIAFWIIFFSACRHAQFDARALQKSDPANA